jgi:glycine cleavage system transcriptional repressor
MSTDAIRHLGSVSDETTLAPGAAAVIRRRPPNVAANYGDAAGTSARAYARAVRHLAVSALGRDRPGIVAAVTEVLLRHDLNIEDSQMTILRGHFTMVLVVSGPDALDPVALRADLEGVARGLGLEAVSVKEVADAHGEPPDPTHIATVYGADHPGIVHAAASAVAAADCNITDLNARLSEEEGADALYVLMMEIVAPPDRVDGLRDALARMGRGEGVEVSVRELEHDEL